MNKEKLLKWIEMRIEEHKSKIDEIYKKYDGDKSQYFEGNDRKEYDYHTGARAELVFLKQCMLEHKAFD